MKNKISFIVAICCLNLAVLPSCNIINPSEPIPSYVVIDTMYLTTNLALQGSASHKITDVWVYVDNEPVGTYEMPARFPVLASGRHKISISAGVLLNGINATHLSYPYYQSYNDSVDLQPGQDNKLTNVTTAYEQDAIFDLKEDFEGLIPFSPSDGSPAGMTIGNDAAQSFEGGYGVVSVDTGVYSFEIKSNQVTLPNDGTLVYLEMNYKNSTPFLVVLQSEDALGNTAKNTVLAINTRSEWNKIYVELKPAMALTPNATKFRLLFGFVRSTAATKENFYFDNVKVVRN